MNSHTRRKAGTTIQAIRTTSLAAAISLAFGHAAAQQANLAEQQGEVMIITGTTPLGSGLRPLNQVAAPVQTLTDRDFERTQALDLSDQMSRLLSGVHVNNNQGNPLQADLNYRGFTASPVLGTPQGLSVYIDGMRVNQPFGDVVSWDMLPKSAIAAVSLMPGANPLYGLNTLGGAIVMRTKDGLNHAGTQAQITAGSWGRALLDVEHGGNNGKGLHWFISAHGMREDGWRDASPSRLGQVFGKLGWGDGPTTMALSMTHTNSAMHGNGLQEFGMLARDYRSSYTLPDITKNQATTLNLTWQHKLSASSNLDGNLYWRTIRSSNLNGDGNEGALDQNVYTLSADDRAALAAAGYTNVPASITESNTPFPFWRCIAQALQADEPGEKCNAIITRGSSTQTNYGATLQWSNRQQGQGWQNDLTVGAALDLSRTHFKQLAQLGYLDASRSAVGVNAYADGVTGGVVDGEPLDTRVDLSGATRTWSLYASNTTSWHKQWHLTLGARYNETRVRNADHINAPGSIGSLDGTHSYRRLNPSIGLTWTPSRDFSAYGGYSESSRTPTSIELGCANPEAPCKLPNAMASDPPLHQVVTKSVELGLRGRLNPATRWHAGVFHAVNTNDLLFVADDQTGYGYFKNFGKTQRKGLELGLQSRVGAVAFGANYTMLDATYQSNEMVNGSSNSTNEEAEEGNKGVEAAQEVHKGDRIPLIPKHILKAWVDIKATQSLSIGLDFQGISGVYARGNENNKHQADGTYYLGRGKTAGFGVLNLNARYQATPKLQLMLIVNNVLDKRYVTSAALSPMAFNGGGAFMARPFAAVNGEYPLVHSTFVAPGAPRGIWLAARYSFGR